MTCAIDHLSRHWHGLKLRLASRFSLAGDDFTLRTSIGTDRVEGEGADAEGAT